MIYILANMILYSVQLYYKSIEVADETNFGSDTFTPKEVISYSCQLCYKVEKVSCKKPIKCQQYVYLWAHQL